MDKLSEGTKQLQEAERRLDSAFSMLGMDRKTPLGIATKLKQVQNLLSDVLKELPSQKPTLHPEDPHYMFLRKWD